MRLSVILLVSTTQAYDDTQVKAMDANKLQGWMTKLFHRLDRDTSGQVEYAEIIEWIGQLDGAKRREHAVMKFGEYDHDGDYLVSLEEYLKQLGQAALVEQNKQRFAYCDENGDGYHERHTNDFLKRQHGSIDVDKNALLSRNELEESPIFKGFNKDDADSELRFENWDSDGDETVSLDEFNVFMRKLMSQKRQIKADSIFTGVDSNGDQVFQLDEFLDNAGLLSKSALTKFGSMYHDEL